MPRFKPRFEIDTLGEIEFCLYVKGRLWSLPYRRTMEMPVTIAMEYYRYRTSSPHFSYTAKFYTVGVGISVKTKHHKR